MTKDSYDVGSYYAADQLAQTGLHVYPPRHLERSDANFPLKDVKEKPSEARCLPKLELLMLVCSSKQEMFVLECISSI